MIRSFFDSYFIFKSQTCEIQTDTEGIKLSYPLVVLVFADRIFTSTFKSTKMDQIVF